MSDNIRKVSDGGKPEEETGHIEVLELPYTEALGMVKTGGIKDVKTIMLL